MTSQAFSTDLSHLRNVAIIAHVDHGKTTLVDALLQYTGAVSGRAAQTTCILDSNPLERERGITIFSKNCAFTWLPPGESEPYRINLIDTPGHADFGGEVERVLRMADGAILLVDAAEGPMPQTRFVLGKALALGLRPIVVINKCDRPDARAHDVLDEVFELLMALGADDRALDFPTLYASGRDGWTAPHFQAAGRPGDTVEPLLRALIAHVPPPSGDRTAPLQMLITTLDYSDYVGRIAIGRVYAGVLQAGAPVAICGADGALTTGRALKVMQFEGLGRVPVARVEAGDLCAVEGLPDFDIGDTIADPQQPWPLPRVKVDPPTVTMLFRINDSPFAGREGRFVTSRQLRQRLERELETNVALRVEPGEGTDEFRVSGRGLLHLGVLLENMRREGYELSVGPPQVIERVEDGQRCEPVELLTLDVSSAEMGPAMELLGMRGAEVRTVETRGDRIHVECEIPSRGLIGLRGRMLTATGGEAVMYHSFMRYAPLRSVDRRRGNGVMVAIESGRATTFSLLNLSERGVMFVRPGDAVYAGQIVGENSRENDMGVNVVKAKALSNVRESNKEATVTLKAARLLDLEAALEYIESDELVEITPAAIRIRKRLLDENQRKRADRQRRSAAAST
jgi:GTP-binding protein